MVLKWKDLVEFVRDLHKKGYIEKIPETHLIREIMKRFGVSDYIIRNILKSLTRTGMMKNNNMGFWIFVKLEDQDKELKKVEKLTEELTGT